MVYYSKGEDCNQRRLSVKCYKICTLLEDLMRTSGGLSLLSAHDIRSVDNLWEICWIKLLLLCYFGIGDRTKNKVSRVCVTTICSTCSDAGDLACCFVISQHGK